MKVSDYIVEFFINKGITDVFGYPGGMVTQLMDSFRKYDGQITAHVNYHEQGAAFAACGYAQVSGKVGVAYATSGPGATNLITGICHAFFDSVPAIFITGQVNRNEARGSMGVRQRGFQETDIVSVVTPVTKYAAYVEDAGELPAELEKAYDVANSGRKGPVLLDIPMDVFRAEIERRTGEVYSSVEEKRKEVSLGEITAVLSDALGCAKAPVFLIGGGVKSSNMEGKLRELLGRKGIPVIASMIAFDVMKCDPVYYGFLGAYGDRTANFIAAKCDLLITIGTRLDIRQVGVHRDRFAPNATIIRFDIDPGELEYRVHENETQMCTDIETVLDALAATKTYDFRKWLAVCDEIKRMLSDTDHTPTGRLVEELSNKIPDDTAITTDVGQNQVWVAQSFHLKQNQKVLFSGGHGAMGYALPAAIGAYYGTGKKTVYCITGDGGMQMNIQELQFIARERLPIKIVVLNNNALGMIRHFQEMYFDSRYFQTKPEGGYEAPSFARIAEAYGIKGRCIEPSEVMTFEWSDGAELLEVMIRNNTYVIPKLEFGKPNQDQEPLIDRKLYERIMSMQP